MPVPLKTKYLSLPASRPWPSIAGTRFFERVMCDIDRDGRDEVVAFVPDASGLLPGSLGILSYFDSRAMATEWADAPQPQQLLAQSVLSDVTPDGATCWQGRFRDKEHVDLLVFDGDGVLSLWTWTGDYTDSDASPMLTNVWRSVGDIVNGETDAGAWRLDFTNRFYVGDFDGDGVDEILAFDPLSLFTRASTLGLLKWSTAGQALQTTWMAAGAVPGAGTQGSWTLAPADSFYVGDVDSDGKAEIIAFDRASTMAVIRWTDKGLALFWSTYEYVYSNTGGSDWRLNGADWFHIADICGDGQNEIIAFSAAPFSGALGAIRWDGTDLRMIGMSAPSGVLYESRNPEKTGWILNESQLNYVGAFKKGGRAVIVTTQSNPLFADAYGAIGVLSWSAAKKSFTVDYAVTGALINPENGASWPSVRDTTFAFADICGDGVVELVVQSDSAAGMGLMKWDGCELTPIWSWFTPQDSSASTPAPLAGWGVNVVADAPATAFTPFEPAVREEIYEKASLSVTDGVTRCLRSTYTNSNDSYILGSWAGTFCTALSDLNNVEGRSNYWDWMKDYSIGDLNAVLGTLYAETYGASTIQAFWSNMTVNLIGAMQSQQNSDLDTVWQNVTQSITADSGADYWTGQIADALLWGIAAIPLDDPTVEPVVGAIVASLFGSLMGSFGSASADNLSVTELQKVVTANAQAATTALDASMTALLTDPIKLVMAGRLLADRWNFSPAVGDAIAAATTNINRLFFYQMSMPAFFEISTWSNISGTSPFYYSGTPWGPVEEPIEPPAWATWHEDAGQENSGLYNVFLITTRGSIIGLGEISYPVGDLMSDLFNTIGVGEAAFWNGWNGWAIPSFQYYPQNPDVARKQPDPRAQEGRAECAPSELAGSGAENANVRPPAPMTAVC
jgi:hypothetical protein